MEIPGRTAENYCQASHSLCRDFNQRPPKYAAGLHVIWGLHSTVDGDASLLTFVTFDQKTWHHIPDDLSLDKAGILPSQLGPTVLFLSSLNHALTSALVLSVFLKSSCRHTGLYSRILWHNISRFTLQLSMQTHFYLCICITYTSCVWWEQSLYYCNQHKGMTNIINLNNSLTKFQLASYHDKTGWYKAETCSCILHSVAYYKVIPSDKLLCFWLHVYVNIHIIIYIVLLT